MVNLLNYTVCPVHTDTCVDVNGRAVRGEYDGFIHVFVSFRLCFIGSSYFIVVRRLCAAVYLFCLRVSPVIVETRKKEIKQGRYGSNKKEN